MVGVLPITFAKRPLDFFSNRQTRVQINGEKGYPLPLRQGLPQGSPLLFKLYLNYLKTFATNGVEVAMLADNVFLFSSHPCKVTAQAAMREAVIRVAEWNRQHKMTLNTEKCEVEFFTSSRQST